MWPIMMQNNQGFNQYSQYNVFNQGSTNIYNNYIAPIQMSSYQYTMPQYSTSSMNLMPYIMQLINYLMTPQQTVIEEVTEEVIEDTTFWGDPHFKFKDKTGKEVTIDHKGTNGETYDVLNGDGLDIDAEYKRWNATNPQVMGAVRISAGGQELLMNKGKVTLDGKELKAGTTQTLADGRTVKVEKNGNVSVSTRDGKGSVNFENNNGYYDISTNNFTVDTSKDKGGVMGFLATEGKKMTKAEILAQYDANKNGMIDNGDGNLNSIFKANKDIGIYN